jgi:diaminopimelate decarboxylase
MENENLVIDDNLETPYFLLDKKELNKNLINLESALKTHWGNFVIGYSFKTNALPWLLSYFKSKGVFAEVVSDDEYDLARLIGFESKKIIYNGPPKSKETFFEAIKNRCIVNIDSQRELQWLNEVDVVDDIYEVGIRVNFDLEKYCPNESAMGSSGGRFGFCYENGELKNAIDYIQSLNHVKLVGIHLHCSTKTRSVNIYRSISKVACEIKRNYNLELKYVDIGGGFFGGLKDKPQFSDYIQVISNELSEEFDKEKVTLIVEPGTSLVSSPFSFVTSVIDVKQTTKNYFVTTDGSRTHIDPFKNKSSYFFNIKQKVDRKREILSNQVISGFTCMEDDRLFDLEDRPQLYIGDKVIYNKVGAYTMCFAPLFIRYFPAVYVLEGNTYHHVRERWTAKEYVLNSKY